MNTVRRYSSAACSARFLGLVCVNRNSSSIWTTDTRRITSQSLVTVAIGVFVRQIATLLEVHVVFNIAFNVCRRIASVILIS